MVAINKFTHDTDKEIELVKKVSNEAGAEGAFVSEVWAKGGKGGVELAEAVVSACEKNSNFNFLYPLDITFSALKFKRIAVFCQITRNNHDFRL